MAEQNRNTDLNPNAEGSLQGSSYIYKQGTTPNTRTAISQKVRILTPTYGGGPSAYQMGVVASFNQSESKQVDEVRGIGFGDQIAELVPSITQARTADFERALLYLCNLWQATGYASGINGPVRSLKHHRWPFDIEEQLVFSTLADHDLGVANVGYNGGQGGTGGTFDGGVQAVKYPEVTNSNQGKPGDTRGHSAIITIHEACWFTSYSKNYSKDTGVIMESGSVMITDSHDFSTNYGEFIASGNDPSYGETGSIRFNNLGSTLTRQPIVNI